MKVEPKSFVVGALTVIAIAAIFAWPHRDEIAWAIKNHKTLSTAGDVVSTAKGFLGIFGG